MTPMKPIAAKPDDNFLKNLGIHFTEGTTEGNACVTVGNYQHSSTSFTRNSFMDLNMGIEEDSNWQQSQQQQQFNHNFATSRSNQFSNGFHDNGHHSATAPTSAMSFLDSNGKWTDELIHEFNKAKSNGFTSFSSSYNSPWHQVELRPEVPDLNMSQESVSSGLKFTDQSAPMTPGMITQNPGTIIEPSVHIQARTCSGEDGTTSFAETQENGIRRPRMQVTPVTPFTFVRQSINFQMDGDCRVGQQQCDPSVLQMPNGTGSEKTAAPMLNPAYRDDFSVCATAGETIDATSTGVHDASVPETDFEKAPGKKPRRKKVRPKVVREDKPRKASKTRVPGETPADVKPKRAYKRRNPEEQTNGEGKAAVRKKQGPTGTKQRGRPPFNHVMTPEAKDPKDITDEVRTSGNPTRRRSLNFDTPAPQLDGIVDNHQTVTESAQQQPPREETLVGHISFDLNMEANVVHDFTGPSLENGFSSSSNKRKESPSSDMDCEVLTKKSSAQCNGMLPQNQHGCRISQVTGGYPPFDSDNREKLVFASKFNMQATDTITSQEHLVATASSQINNDLCNYDTWLLSEKLREENHIHALDGNHNQQQIQEIPYNQNSGTRAGRLDNTSFDGYEACYSMKENETTLLKSNSIPADMQSTTMQAKSKEVYTLAGDTGLFQDANHHWSQSNFGLPQAHDSNGALDGAQFKQVWNVTQQSPQIGGIRNFMDEGFSFGNSEGVQTFTLQGFADTCNSEVTNEEPVLPRPPKLNFKQRARNPDLNNMKEQSNLALGQGTQMSIQGQQPANSHEFSNSSISNDGLTTGDSSQIVSFTGLLEVVVRQQRNLDINNNEDRSMVPYQNESMVPYQNESIVPFQNEIVPYVGAGQMMPYEVKKRRPRPKVDLDEETQRVWKLLLENINSDGIDGTDAEKQRWWEEERRIFRGRAESFIAKMHMVQGDRRFSRWKGSVVDSVVGVFLTQNVSDHLSSSAFMALAARFPLKEGTASNAFEVEKTLDGRIPQDYNDWISERENVRLSQLSDICSTSTDPQSSETKESFSPDMVQTTESYGSNTFGEKDNLVKTAPSADTCIDQESPDSKKINPDIPEPDGCLMSEDKFSFTYSGISRDTFSSNQAEWQGVAQTQHLLTASEHVNSYMHEFGTPSFTDLLSMAESNSFSDLYLNMNHTFQPEKLPSIPDQLQSLQQTEIPILSKPGDQAGMHTTYNQMQANYMAAPLISSLGLPVDSTAFTGRERDCLGRPKDDASFPHHAAVCSKETVRTITSSPINFQGIASTMTIEMPRDEVSCIATCVSDEGNDTSEEASRCAPPFWETNLTNERNFPVEQANFNASSQALNVLDLDGSRPTRLESNSKGVDENVRTYLEDAKHETLSTSATKARRTKGQASKETEFDWDSLRKDVQSKGLIKERSPDRSDSLDWEAVRCADVKEISDTIKERGMNNMLAERIKAFLNRLKEKHEKVDLEWLRDVPPDKAKEFLLSIRGLGLKSVECVRLLTLHHLAFPVDTNVGRISVRLGWVPLQPLPESLQIHLLEQYPVLETVQRYLWPRLCKLDQRTLYELHYQLITFGKVFCTKSKPNCNACPMRAECRHFASAFASARLALPGPEEKGIVSTSVPITKENESEKFHIRPVMLLPMGERQINLCEPIIEEPATPEPETDEDSENELSDIEDFEDPNEIPMIKLNLEAFNQNVRSAMENQMMDLQDPNMSKALVALTSEAASLPTPKLKNVSRLRTEHQVYELPDDHQLVQGLDPREPDDPCTYLLAIWTPGETADSIEPPGPSCDSHCAGNLCDKSTCFSCNNTRESNNQIVRATLLIPCRTAMRGSFPLNGTYFQVNEVFADHESSMNPMAVPRSLIWNLPRRTVFFGTSVTSIFRGLTTEGIQFCFWRGFVCVRGFDRKTRRPRPLMARLHFPASKQVRNKTNTAKVKK